MKKIFIALALFSLVFLACSESTSINSPENNKTDNILRFKKNYTNHLMKTEVSQSINGETGGTIDINFTSSDGEFSVVGTLVFPANSFAGTEDITVSVAGDLAALDFGPSMTFQNAAVLNLSLTGVDVSVDDNVDFQYIHDNGDVSNVNYSSVDVDVDAAQVGVQNAELNHFSRYAWTR